jgi:hypothetical protein
MRIKLPMVPMRQGKSNQINGNMPNIYLSTYNAYFLKKLPKFSKIQGFDTLSYKA